MKPPLVFADYTQAGLAVEASNDEGKTWQLVQLTRYQSRPTPTVAAYSQAIDPQKDAEEYFAELTRRGTPFRRVLRKPIA